jgi:predicted 3-demethylubiquinone-9 3-methyltransferase (glyoxalase superfamily)
VLFYAHLDSPEIYACGRTPNGNITKILWWVSGRCSYYGEAGPRPAGTVLTVDFTLDGQEFTAINGGPQFTFDEAISFLIQCAGQDEIDYYWTRLSEGGEEGPCGWLKDRYGLSWQVVPAGFAELMSDPDQGRRDRAPGSAGLNLVAIIH